jgi:hypothetical protein
VSPQPADAALSVALKEWAVVCRALETGRQIVLLRKGGILESLSGFDIEHRRFLLFPTYLHQNPQMLKSGERAGIEPHAAEPQQITLGSFADVTDVIQLHDRTQMNAIDDEHVWSPALIDMRFNYKPQNPLFLLVVRTFVLPQRVTIENTPAYAGCKSWVPLREAIAIEGARPALADDVFAQPRGRILRAL